MVREVVREGTLPPQLEPMPKQVIPEITHGHAHAQAGSAGDAHSPCPEQASRKQVICLKHCRSFRCPQQ